MSDENKKTGIEGITQLGNTGGNGSIDYIPKGIFITVPYNQTPNQTPDTTNVISV